MKFPTRPTPSSRSTSTRGEVVEIACVVGLFAYFNRFNEALQMEPTAPREGVDS